MLDIAKHVPFWRESTVYQARADEVNRWIERQL
jgi:hypothetical protein